MKEDFIIEIIKDKDMLHQGEIFDLCSIGADENHFYRSRGFKENELMIREIGGIYNIAAKSNNWKMNGKSIEAGKYYLLGKKNKLTFDNYKIEIKQITNTSTGGLEIAGPKHDISDLIVKSNKPSNTVDIYNTDKKRSDSESDIPEQLKKLGSIASLASLIFAGAFIYTINWIVIPLNLSPELAEIKTLFKEFLIKNVAILDINYIANNQLVFFQQTFKQSKELIQVGQILDLLAFDLFFALCFYFAFRIIFIVLFNTPFHFLFLGIFQHGKVAAKKFKGIVYEFLNFIFIPLNIYNLGGLLPIKSIPMWISKIYFYQKSRLLKFIGPSILLTLSLALLNFPLIMLQFGGSPIFEIKNLPKKKKEATTTQTLQIKNISLPIPEMEGMEMTTSENKNGEQFSISSSKLKNKITINVLNSPLLDWNTNSATGNLMSFITHPIQGLKNFNLPIPDGLAEQYQAELISSVSQALQLKKENIIDTLFNNIFELGPFTFATHQLYTQINKNIGEASEELIPTYWTKINGEYALIFSLTKKILITFPLDKNSFIIQILAANPSDLTYFAQSIFKELPIVAINPNPSLIDEIFKVIDKINPGDVINKFNNLGDLFNKIDLKNMQTSQKELTDSINQATKAQKEKLDEINQE